MTMINHIIYSSRRRHTRLQGDWSSDVCSSDLDRAVAQRHAAIRGAAERGAGKDFERAADVWAGQHEKLGARSARIREIGRASCREREEIQATVGASIRQTER